MAAVCSKHPHSHIVPAGTVCPRPGVAAHVLLAAPGLNDAPDAPEHSLSCMCCGESHTIVLSYLRPDLQDLHMRPVTLYNLETGEWGIHTMDKSDLLQEGPAWPDCVDT